MKHRLLACLALTALLAAAARTAPPAPRPRYDKLSPMLRQLARAAAAPSAMRHSPAPQTSAPVVCSFVKTAPGGTEALRGQGCRVLAQQGDICIAFIPQDRLAALSLDERIVRIEAGSRNRALNDTTAQMLGVDRAHQGMSLPQTFTGKGVVVGVMDIGFDLTHPTFYSRDTTDYRIRRFWDMLAADTAGAALPVGRDYAGREQLLATGHARDGLEQTHGTHTAGTAAGSGYDSPYTGMAPESDICLVANAVTQDTIYISPDDYYKYTFALDALGFKYIFDYAESVGKPCVINFSEGSCQDFIGYDRLYYEMLSRLCGPGRIIVASAGNNGQDKTWMRKPRGTLSAGSFLLANRHNAMLTLKSADDFTLRLVAYDSGGNDTLDIDTRSVLTLPDSMLTAQMHVTAGTVSVQAEAYPSCYNPLETCFDICFSGPHNIGSSPRLSFEVIGMEADVEAYRVDANFVENALNPRLSDGERSASVLSPAAAPCVICVGSTAYRQSVTNYKGERKIADNGTGGIRARSSAAGPTYDGRTKPDVMAPGINVISSYSSSYIAHHPEANDVKWDVAHFNFNGRTYAWNSNSGTSMASPVVAGVIALWLEACPTLTHDDILGIFERTCRHYDQQLTYPNNLYGYGEVDAYRGLLDILGADKLPGVSTSHTAARISLSADGMLNVQLPHASYTPTTITVYSLQGRLIARERMAPGSRSHSMRLTPQRKGGVGVVQIDGDTESSGSTLIRW